MKIGKSCIFLAVIVLLWCPASSEICGYYYRDFGQYRFNLILSEGKFFLNIEPLNQDFFSRIRPLGRYYQRADTLVLIDTVFQNEYHYRIAGSSLYPVRPNYSFLLERTVEMKKNTSPDYCSKKPFSSILEYKPNWKVKRYFEIDTISAFFPANQYWQEYNSVDFADTTVEVKFCGLTLFKGPYEIINNRVTFYSQDMNRKFVIFQGTKSYKDVVLRVDPMLRDASVQKKYSKSEWYKILGTAEEFKFGREGVGPKVIKSDD